MAPSPMMPYQACSHMMNTQHTTHVTGNCILFPAVLLLYSVRLSHVSAHTHVPVLTAASHRRQHKDMVSE